jgi:hypothetical protein
MIQIETISINETEQEVTVTAVVEDAVLVYPQTQYDPAEYGPALCMTTFSIDSVDVNNEKELQEFLETVDYWEIVDDSDYYDDYPYS